MLLLLLLFVACASAQVSWRNVGRGTGGEATSMHCSGGENFLFSHHGTSSIHTYDVETGKWTRWKEEEGEAISLVSDMPDIDNGVIAVKNKATEANEPTTTVVIYFDVKKHERRRRGITFGETHFPVDTGCMLVFSPSQVLVLNNFGAVYVFDGISWHEETTMAMPAIRARHSCTRMFGEARRHVGVLVGGLQSDGIPSPEVWTLDVHDGLWRTDALPRLPLLGIHDALVSSSERIGLVVGGGYQTSSSSSSSSSSLFFRLLQQDSTEWIPLSSPFLDKKRLIIHGNVCLNTLSSSDRMFMWDTVATYELAPVVVHSNFVTSSSTSSSSSSSSSSVVTIAVVTGFLVLIFSAGIAYMMLNVYSGGGVK